MRLSNCCSLWLAAAILASTVTAQDGLWHGPYSMPLIPVAAANLPDGKILVWSAAMRFNFNVRATGRTFTGIFDPATGQTTEYELVDTEHDMFCPGSVILPDGQVMVTGGIDKPKVSVFDPATSTWKKGPQMNIGRGYHSSVILGDGSVFTVGGTRWNGGTGDTLGEVYSPTKGWDLKSEIDSRVIATNDVGGIGSADNHAWTFQAPNGDVFHAGPSAEMHWIDTSGAGNVQNALRRGDDLDSMNGNAVMFDIGKILKLGGGVNYGRSTPAQNSAFVIDINGGKGQETVTRVGNLVKARSLMDSVVLPNGEVVVVGGSSHAKLFSDDFSILTSEIWNPTTGQFRELGGQQMKVPRNYHSVALLMKDGRVYTGGGGLCGNCNANHPDSEIFTPPYLLNPNGSLKERPTIVSHTEQIPRGLSQMTVSLGAQDSSTQPTEFVMMRLASATHSTNTDQRRIPLAIISQSDDTFILDLPTNENVLVPGTYWLFALVAGVPSMGMTTHVYPANPEAIFGLSNQFEIFPSIAFSGSDYKELVFPQGTTLDGALTLCARACDKDDICLAFTAIKAGFFGDNKSALCHLKNTVPPENTNPSFVDNIIGGKKGDPITHWGEIIAEGGSNGEPTNTYFERLGGIDLRGSDIPGAVIEYATTTTLEKAIEYCEKDCMKIPTCVSVTVAVANYFGDGAGPRCYVKDAVPAKSASPNYEGRLISSIKRQRSSAYFQRVEGIDYRGSDIAGGRIEYSKETTLEAAIELCEEDCSKQSGCVSLTLVDSAFFNYRFGPLCHLKHSVPPGLSEPQYVGHMISAKMVPIQFERLLGIDLRGSDIPGGRIEYSKETTLETAIENCERDCREEPLCVSVTVVDSAFTNYQLGALCHLKHTVPVEVSEPRFQGHMISSKVIPGPYATVESASPTASPMSPATTVPTTSPTMTLTASPTIVTTQEKKPVTPAAQFERLAGIDYRGSDIPGGRIEYPKETKLEDAIDLCERDCLGVAACVAVTVVDASFFNYRFGALCYLKHSVPAQVADPSYIGRMISSRKKQAAVDSFKVLPETNLHGSDIAGSAKYLPHGSSLDSVVEQCSQHCLDTPQCLSFVAVTEDYYGPGSSPSCFLKNTVPNAEVQAPKPAGKMSSGIKILE